MSHLSPFRGGLPGADLPTGSTAKKRRKNAPLPPAPTATVQDLLPPPLTGYGDTIVASNPFDDCPSTMSMRTPPAPMAMHMGMCRPGLGGGLSPQMGMHGPPGPPDHHALLNGPRMGSQMPPQHLSGMNNPQMHGLNGSMVNPQMPGLMSSGPPPGGPGQMPLNVNGPLGPHQINNNFMSMYPKPLPVSAGKIYPADQPMVFNSQNPNAPPIYPCGVCHKEVHDNDQAILCESGCNFWFHRGCTGLTEAAFQLLTAEVYAEWACDKCLHSKSIPLVKFKP